MREDIAFFEHPDRNCIYAEAEFCIARKKDDPAVIESQMKRYKQDRYPANSGLVAGGIIFRKHCASTAELNESWWCEICRGSRRDQLSANYVMDKLGLKYDVIPGSCWKNQYGKHCGHRC
jgi:hypothetical protein